MNMKKFLKFSIGKLGIMGSIFFLTIILRGVVTKTNSLLFKSIELIFSPHYLLYKIWDSFAYPVHNLPPGVKYDILLSPFDIIVTLIIFILGIFYWYFWACLIVFGYNKFKGKIQ